MKNCKIPRFKAISNGLHMFFFLLLTTGVTQAQITWEQSKGPFTGELEGLAIDPTTGDFLVTSRTILYKGFEQGKYWEVLEIDNIYNYGPIQSASDGVVFVLVPGVHLFHSADFGTTWVKQDLPPNAESQSIALAPQGQVMLISQIGRPLYSDNYGDTWDTLMTLNSKARSIYYDELDQRFIAATDDGVWETLDNGQTWTSMNQGELGMGVLTRKVIRVLGTNTLIVAGIGRIFRSTDNGQTWTKVSTLFSFQDMATSGPGVIFGSAIGGKLYFSLDDGLTWAQNESPELPVDCGFVWGHPVDHSVYVSGENGDGIRMASSPESLNWELIGIPDTEVNSLLPIKGQDIVLAATNDSIFRSDDQGVTWEKSNDGVTHPFMHEFAQMGNTLVARSTFGGIYISEDYGLSWEAPTNPLPGTFFNALSTTSNRIYLASSAFNQQVNVSSTKGETWVPFNQGLPDDESIHHLLLVTPEGELPRMFGTSAFGVYLTTNTSTTANWVLFSQGLPAFQEVHDIVSDPTGTYVYLCGDFGLYRSLAKVDQWTRLDDQLPADVKPVRSLIPIDENTWMAGTYKGIYTTIDGGLTWQSNSEGLRDVKVTCLETLSQGKWMAGTASGGVHIGTGIISSIDKGLSPPQAMTIFPNPTSNILVVKTTVSEGASWEAVNALGQKFKLDVIDHNEFQTTLSLKHLIEGTYWINANQKYMGTIQKLN